MSCLVVRKCLWFQNFQLQKVEKNTQKLNITQPKKEKKKTNETNHRIAFSKDQWQQGLKDS